MKPRGSNYRRRRFIRKARYILLTTVLAIGAVFWFSFYAPDVGHYMMTGQFPAAQEGPRITRGGDAWSGSGRTPTRRQTPAQASAAEPGAQLIDVVTRVRDGDTIVVGLIPIRIANLDCAESGTTAGERATRRMSELVQGQQLTCTLEGRRSWDREVGVCALPDRRDIGEILIAERLCDRWRGR